MVALVGFLVSLPLVFQFDRNKDYQFVEKRAWIPSLGATYHIGIDGFGLLLVMLTTVHRASSPSCPVGTRSRTG